MKEKMHALPVTPLMGTERACFEQHRDRLCAAYASQVQGLVDEWEATSEAVGALRRKRFLEVRMAPSSEAPPSGSTKASTGTVDG